MQLRIPEVWRCISRLKFGDPFSHTDLMMRRVFSLMLVEFFSSFSQSCSSIGVHESLRGKGKERKFGASAEYTCRMSS